MKKQTLFLIISVIIIVVGIGAYSLISSFLAQKSEEEKIKSTSDISKVSETVRFAADGWIGYSIFRSPQFDQFLAREEIAIDYTDDQADYEDRMKKFAEGEYDIIAATLDSYLVNARVHDYPGVIVFVIDESKGGDGIVARKDLDSLQNLAKPGVTIALTPNSPSDFLLSSVAAHFDLAPLKVDGDWRKETEGSTAALKELESGNVDAAVLWEPELTRATSDPRFTRLLGTESTQGLILDICIVNRDYLSRKPEVVEKFVRQYFQTLKYYSSDRDEFVELIANDSGTSTDQAKIMLDGVEFGTLTKNAHHWFGIGPVEIAKTHILSSAKANMEILLETKKIPSDPFDGKFRAIMNSSLIETLYHSGLGSSATQSVFTGPGAGVDQSAVAATIVYPALSDEQWATLEIVGRLKIRPIVFQSGTSFLTLDGKRTIDRISEDLALYPRFRLLVRGHTTPEGDEDANKKLSLQRAESVSTYLKRVHDIPEARMKTEGVGGAMPLEQEEGESFRRWKGRLSRVELLLVEDPNIE